LTSGNTGGITEEYLRNFEKYLKNIFKEYPEEQLKNT